MPFRRYLAEAITSDEPHNANLVGYLGPVTLAQRVPLETSPRAGVIEAEIVAVVREDGSDCYIDAFFDPQHTDTRPLIGDCVLLAGLRDALARLELPASSLRYDSADAQEDHCIAFVAGADLAGTVLAMIAELETKRGQSGVLLLEVVGAGQPDVAQQEAP